MNTFSHVWVFSDTPSRLPELMSGALASGEQIHAFVQHDAEGETARQLGANHIVTDIEKEILRIEQTCGREPGSTGLLAAIESPLGITRAVEIAHASERLIGIALGAEDYVRNLRTERSPEGTELLFARCSILQAARSAGIQAFDTVYSDANNEAGFLHEASHIKQLGFDGKSLINPRQIELLHNLYAPTLKEVAHARLVVEAAEAAAREGRGVVSLNGKMVDSPVIERARLVLSRAELSGIREE